MSENTSAALKWRKNKAGLIDAYTGYQNSEPGSIDRLMLEVRAFAFTKVLHLEWDFRNFGSAETADDWAQDIVVRVWRNLDKFQGSPEDFFSWVHKIAFNKGQTAFRQVKRHKDTKVSLFVEEPDEEGKVWNEDNPDIYTVPGGYDDWFSLPDSLSPIDRNICSLIYEGRSYAQIARELNMTEKAVEVRMYKLRNRLPAEKEAKKEKYRHEREIAEKERKESLTKGLAKLHASRLPQAAD